MVFPNFPDELDGLESSWLVGQGHPVPEKYTSSSIGMMIINPLYFHGNIKFMATSYHQPV